MSKQNQYARGNPIRRGSLYTVPEDADGDELIFGDFAAQQILGYRCSIHVERVTEEQSAKGTRFHDMLGVRCARGDLAVHISGRDDFGDPGEAGEIEELGLYRRKLNEGQGRGPSGLGFGPEADAVVFLSTSPRHQAFWSQPSCIVTATGLLSYWLESQPRGRALPFSCDDVLEYIDALDARSGVCRLKGDKWHRRAIRELCKLIIEEQETRSRCWYSPSKHQGLREVWGLKRRSHGRYSWECDGPVPTGVGRRRS